MSSVNYLGKLLTFKNRQLFFPRMQPMLTNKLLQLYLASNTGSHWVNI